MIDGGMQAEVGEVGILGGVNIYHKMDLKESKNAWERNKKYGSTGKVSTKKLKKQNKKILETTEKSENIYTKNLL